MNKSALIDLLAFRPNNVINGNFQSGTTNWNVFAGASQAVVNGELELTAVTTAPFSTQCNNFTLVRGRQYRFTGSFRAAAGNSVANSARISLIDNSVSIVQFIASGNGNQRNFEFIYNKTSAGVAYVICEVASGAAWGAVGDKAYFRDIAVR